MAILIQETAKQGGIQINLVTKANSVMRKEHTTVYNYDLALLLTGSDLADDDPYNPWHSDNASDGNKNITGYVNKEVDSLIEKIRGGKDPVERKKLYRKMQEILYEDQPVVFLYCPLNKIITNRRLSGTSTIKRPGYMANTFKRAL